MKVLGIHSAKTWFSKNFKVIFNRGSWVSMRSNGIGVEERHQLKTLLAALWRISSIYQLFLLAHSTCVLFFVLVISTRACDSGSFSATFSETFIMAHFVVKPTLRSNKPSKFKSFVRYHRRLANSHLS